MRCSTTRLFVAALSVVVLLVMPMTAVSADYSKGCNSKACMKRVCKSSSCQARVARKHSAHQASATRSSNPMVNPVCESGGNPQVWDPSGTYWGKYQFDRQTWIAHGGSPSSYGNASVAEQDRVAARVKYDAWPNC
jgi:hypothetical protein